MPTKKNEKEETIVYAIIDGKEITNKTRLSSLQKILKDIQKEMDLVKGKEKEVREELIKRLEYLIDKKQADKKKSISDISIVLTPVEVEEVVDKISKVHTTDDDSEVNINVETVVGLSKELRQSTVSIGKRDARYLTDTFYQIQKIRIGLENQVRSVNQNKDGEGNPSIMEYAALSLAVLEKSIASAFETFVESRPETKWMTDIKGIGPTIATVLYAYFNVDGVESAGNFWSYAGLNNNNNPWLGKEKAAQIVNELYKIRSIKSRGFKSVIKDLVKQGVITNDTINAIVNSISSKKINYDEIAVKELIFKVLGDQLANDTCAKAYDAVKDQLIEFKQINEGDGLEITPEALQVLTEEEIERISNEEDKTFGFIDLSVPFDSDDLVDYFMSLSDTNIITEKLISMLMIKLNSRRTYATIKKNSVEKRENDKYFGRISKESLRNYLSKPPYNINLKVTMWKIGEQFMRNSNRGSLYGKFFQERRALEIERNERHEYASQAFHLLKAKNYNKGTSTYQYLSKGMLSPDHINARAKRYATKLFISHVFEMMYISKNGKMPKTPYVISVGDHVDYIGPEVPYDKYFKYTK